MEIKELDYTRELFTQLKDELFNKIITDAFLLSNSLEIELDTDVYDYYICIEPTWNISYEKGLLVGSRGLQDISNDKEKLTKYGKLIRDRIVGKRMAYIGINNCLDIEIGIDTEDYTWIRTLHTDHRLDSEEEFTWRITKYNLEHDLGEAISLRCSGLITQETLKTNKEV